VRVLGESDFLWEDYLHAQPENLLPMIADPGQWRRGRGPSELATDRTPPSARRTRLSRRANCGGSATASSSAPGCARSSAGSGGPEGFSAELSAVAEAVLQGADSIVRQEFAPSLPRRADGLPVASALLALGKLGGRELGFGSDLELMLVYDDRDVAEVVGGDGGGGEPRPRRRGPCGASWRSVGAGRSRSTSGSVPTGGLAGPPRRSRRSPTTTEPGGPAWGFERQALVKLRAVAGDPGLGREIEALRDRFVYGPEPFDLEGCRRLRRLQVEQLIRPGTVNAKYSPGALVDVEYFVQALQIAHGAAAPAVRTPSTLRAIAALGACGRLDPGRVERLAPRLPLSSAR